MFLGKIGRLGPLRILRFKNAGHLWQALGGDQRAYHDGRAAACGRGKRKNNRSHGELRDALPTIVFSRWVGRWGGGPLGEIGACKTQVETERASLSHSLARSHSLTHSRAHTVSLAGTLTLSLTRALTLSHSHARSYCLTHTRARIL